MPFTRLHLVFLSLFVYGLSFAQGSQSIYATLDKQGSTNNIKIHSLSGNSSLINFGDVDMLNTNDHVVKLFRYDKTEDFELVMQVENETQNDISFSCGSEANPNSPQLYNIHFVNGLFEIDVDGVTILSNSYDNDDIFKIYKCKTSMAFYLNETLLHYQLITSNIDLYSHYLQAVNSNATDFFMVTNLIEDCLPPYDVNSYFVLKSQIPENIAILLDGKLNFSFIQKYNVPASETSMIRIYNSDRTNQQSQVDQPIYSSVLQKEYGPNYTSLDINELGISLVAGEIYTLEVDNINKNQTYYLKFKM